MISIAMQNAQDLEAIMKDPDKIDTNGFQAKKNGNDPYKTFVSSVNFATEKRLNVSIVNVNACICKKNYLLLFKDLYDFLCFRKIIWSFWFWLHSPPCWGCLPHPRSSFRSVMINCWIIAANWIPDPLKRNRARPKKTTRPSMPSCLRSYNSSTKL